MNTPADASHLSQSASDKTLGLQETEDPNNASGTDAVLDVIRHWPTIEEQLEYWKTHDHGGNVLPSRIKANQGQYPVYEPADGEDYRDQE